MRPYTPQLCAVHLVDVHHCGDASKFISAVLLSLTAMVRLELPHINVLTKLDTLASQGDLREWSSVPRVGVCAPRGAFFLSVPSSQLPVVPRNPVLLVSAAFDLDFYAEAQDLHHVAALIRSESSTEGGSADSGVVDSLEAAASRPACDGPGSVGPPPGGKRRGFMQRFARLNDKIVEIIQDHSLVSFVPMSIKVRLRGCAITGR
jgi:hypothetical protein